MPYKGGSSTNGNPLKYPRNYYTPVGLKSDVLTEAQARAEYSRLRSIARKRLERFVGTEWEDSEVYTRNKGAFPPVPELKNRRALNNALMDVAKFLSHPTSSVSGLERARKNMLSVLQDPDGLNLKHINKNNVRAFGEFMEFARTRSIGKLRESDQAAKLFDTAVAKNIPPEEIMKNFDFWMDNLEKMEEMPRFKSDKPRSSADYQKALIAPTQKKKSRKK